MNKFFEQQLPYSVIRASSDFFCTNSSKHYSRNKSLHHADFIQQQIHLDLGEMCNIRYLVIEDLTYGCEMSVYISEFKNGPYVPVVQKQLVVKHKQRKVTLSSLPARFIKIIVHKGVHLQQQQVTLIGATTEKLAEEGGLEDFKMLVANAQRILY